LILIYNHARMIPPWGTMSCEWWPLPHLQGHWLCGSNVNVKPVSDDHGNFEWMLNQNVHTCL